jgi:hypothetical protein
VAAADAALAPLLRPILDAAERGNTLVMLTSDHGEALGEHGEATHGIFAYQGVLAVPLILFQPRLLGPRVVETPARHVDLLPTILDAVSLPAPGGLRGRSLLPAAAGAPAGAPATTYFEALSGQLNRGWAPLYGLIQEGWKYIDLPIPELYDLTADPAEERNLVAAEPRRLAAMREALQPLRELDPGAVASPESAEIRDRLRSLGYLSGGSPAARTVYTEEDDPKRLIELDAIQRRVAGLYSDGDLPGALRLCRQLVRRRPGMRMALLDLAQLERESGDLEAAIEALERAFALNPEDPAALALLAGYLTQAGRADEAVELTGHRPRQPQGLGLPGHRLPDGRPASRTPRRLRGGDRDESPSGAGTQLARHHGDRGGSAGGGAGALARRGRGRSPGARQAARRRHRPVERRPHGGGPAAAGAVRRLGPRRRLRRADRARPGAAGRTDRPLTSGPSGTSVRGRPLIRPGFLLRDLELTI